MWLVSTALDHAGPEYESPILSLTMTLFLGTAFSFSGLTQVSYLVLPRFCTALGAEQDKRGTQGGAFSVSCNAVWKALQCSPFSLSPHALSPQAPSQNASSTRKPFPTPPARARSLSLRVTYSLHSTLSTPSHTEPPVWFPICLSSGQFFKTRAHESFASTSVLS